MPQGGRQGHSNRKRHQVQVCIYRGNPGPVSEGKSQVPRPVSKKVGPSPHPRKARSGFLFEGRPGLGLPSEETRSRFLSTGDENSEPRSITCTRTHRGGRNIQRLFPPVHSATSVSQQKAGAGNVSRRPQMPAFLTTGRVCNNSDGKYATPAPSWKGQMLCVLHLPPF